jgi:hypothetical protein
METPPARAGWVCALCGATAEELASPLHPAPEGPIVIRYGGHGRRSWVPTARRPEPHRSGSQSYRLNEAREMVHQ